MRNIKQQGFTLVELLVALAMSGVVAAAAIGFFISQQRAHTAQEQVTLMQQNLRTSLDFMTRELRVAGYNPTAQTATPMGFSTPGLNTITFTLDFHGLESDGIDNDGNGTVDDEVGPDGDSNDSREQITYSMNPAANTFQLRRKSSAAAGAANEVLADGIEAIAFAYAYDGNDADTIPDTFVNAAGATETIYAIAGPNGIGPLDATPPVDWFRVDANGIPIDTGTPARAADIRAVKIWILARSNNIDREYFNNTQYIVGTQTFNPNDNRRRRLLETVVRCRNMGLISRGVPTP